MQRFPINWASFEVDKFYVMKYTCKPQIVDLEHPNVFSLAIEGKIKLFFEPIPLKELSFEVDQLQRCILCISFSKERFLGVNLIKSLNNNFYPFLWLLFFKANHNWGLLASLEFFYSSFQYETLQLFGIKVAVNLKTGSNKRVFLLKIDYNMASLHVFQKDF